MWKLSTETRSSLFKCLVTYLLFDHLTKVLILGYELPHHYDAYEDFGALVAPGPRILALS